MLVLAEAQPKISFNIFKSFLYFLQFLIGNVLYLIIYISYNIYFIKYLFYYAMKITKKLFFIICKIISTVWNSSIYVIKNVIENVFKLGSLLYQAHTIAIEKKKSVNKSSFLKSPKNYVLFNLI